MPILNRKIIKSIIAEERATSLRYAALARDYNLPVLSMAAHDEAHHAKIFEEILRRGNF